MTEVDRAAEAVPREVAAYLDEPPQLATGSPGKNGYLRLGFERRGRKTVLADLDRRAPLLVQQALYWDEAMPDLPCVFMISNAGGVLQGDRNRIEIRLGPNAQAHVTTQSATKIHEMDHNHAAQQQEIVLAEGAYLEYLPEATIPHRHSRYLTRTQIELAPTASLLYAEILAAGRKHYRDGERFAYDVFSSTVTAVRPGLGPVETRELFTEKFVIEPPRHPLAIAGLMGDHHVFGNVLLLTSPDRAAEITAQVTAGRDRDLNCIAAAATLPNDAGLVYKVLGMETQPVRSLVRRFWEVARPVLTGCEVPPEFAWR
jgi:urease accessory protein